MRPLALRNVLVATDLTDALLPAIQTAGELARLAGARVHVIHVQEESIDESALSEHVFAAKLDPDVLGDVRTLRGPPAVLIAQEAWRTEADVIVMGPHRGERDHELGSTADRVVRTAPVPCLILPTPLAVPLQRILVPVDAIPGARGILEVGFTWASALRRRGPTGADRARVTALHITGLDADANGSSSFGQETETMRDHLAHLAGVEMEEVVEEGSDPVGAILRHLEADAYDLLLLGTRGERAKNGKLLGSVSSAVLGQTRRPTLLVPPEVWRREAQEPLP